jgi:hypothetical protein
MIPGRCCYDSALLFFRREQRQRISRASLFKTPRALQIFQLTENLHASDFRQRYRCRTWRLNDVTPNPFRSRLDILELHAAFIPITRPNI